MVEGYTDVMMAHQHGIANVVATMGTALNAKHVFQLRRYVPRVVLVFDADAGGATGVDRALEIFISQDVELLIATLPEGSDPCDLLVARGADALKVALKSAVHALDFKINQLLVRDAYQGIEGTKRMVDAVLGLLALAPEMPGKAGQVKVRTDSDTRCPSIRTAAGNGVGALRRVARSEEKRGEANRAKQSRSIGGTGESNSNCGIGATPGKATTGSAPRGPCISRPGCTRATTG